MPICYGPVASRLVKKPAEIAAETSGNKSCCVCASDVGKGLECLHPTCDMSAHIICLSRVFLNEGEYVPVSGSCPKCDRHLLWGDLVRKYRGCYDVEENEDVCDDSS